MPYTPTTWVNGSTPIDAANLNNMESGIVSANAALPIVVASAINIPVTSTGIQYPLLLIPTATGFYRANLAISYSNIASSTLFAYMSFKDPNLGTPTAYFSNGTQFYNALAIGSGSVTLFAQPIVFYAAAGTDIQFYYHDTAGTPNDHVSCVLEQLA